MTPICEAVATSSTETSSETEERRFVGPPVTTQVAATITEDGPATYATLTEWAVCLAYEEEDDEPRKYYVAQVVAFPGVVSQGLTETEARANIKEALSLALECMDSPALPTETDYMIPAHAKIIYVSI